MFVSAGDRRVTLTSRLVHAEGADEVGDLLGVLAGVVFAGDEYVLNTDFVAAKLGPLEQGIANLREVVLAIDRHDLGAIGVVGRVERECDAKTMPAFAGHFAGEAVDAIDAAHCRDSDVAGGDVCAVVIAEDFDRGDHVFDVVHRLAHAHEDDVVDGKK